MEIIVFEKEAYYKMLEEMKMTMLDAIKDLRVETKKVQNSAKQNWVNTAEAQKILKCKYLKLRQIRDRKGSDIVYSVDGRKVLYSVDSLYEHLNKKAVH